MTGTAFRALTLGLALTGCGGIPGSTVTLPADRAVGAGRRDEPPVALDPQPPVEYPLALVDRRIGGTVLVRMFVDDSGQVVRESTRIQESSGYPALDSAALAAAPKLRYAPALRNGVPTAAPFLQPFHFRAAPAGGTPP